jgi:hypothetical protein
MPSNVIARNAVLANSQKRQDEKLQMREQLKRAKEKKEDGKIGGKSGKLAISSHGSLAASSGMNAEALARESINARRESKLHRKQAASMGSAGGVSPQKQGRPSRASEGDEDHHADEPEDKAPLEPCPHVNLQWRKPAGERPAGAPDDDDTNPWRRTVSDKVLATWVKSIPSHLGGGAPMGLTTLFASAFRRVEANLKKQETLWWNRQHWDDEKALLLAELVGGGCLRKLKTLSIYGNHFTDVGTDALFEAMRRGIDGSGLDSPKLRTINMAGCSMSAEGAPALCRMLCSGVGKHLQMLNLNGNQLGDDGFRVLCEAAGHGGLAAVTNLSVKGNRIGDEGIRVMARAVIDGGLARVILLTMSDNLIGDRGLSDLSLCLAGGGFPNLSSLNMSGNEFGTEGTMALVQAASSAKGGAFHTLRSLALRSRDEIRRRPERSLEKAQCRLFLKVLLTPPMSPP